jgi:two-component system response regulator MprA
MQRIAIIDDDAATRSTLDLALADEGYETRFILGPGDLLAQLTADRPDLVLLDLLLGRWGDGLALAAAIHGDPLLAHTPVIILTAARDMLRQHAGALAALGYPALEKPFDLDDLFALIAGALSPAATCSAPGVLA